MDEAGENYYLDQEGNRIPASRNYTARVMVATGPINSYSLDFKSLEHHNLKEALLLACRIMEDDFLEGIVQQLHVLPGGEWMLVPLLGRQKVILGSVDDLKNKFERLKIFYQEAMPYTGWNTYSTLNVKYNGQVVCK
jgi:cell division protein FtsQ